MYRRHQREKRGKQVISASELPEFVATLSPKKEYVKFTLEHNNRYIPAVFFPFNDGFTLLLTENPVEWFYDSIDVYDDNFTDSCLIMKVTPQVSSSVDNLSNSSCGADIQRGWQVMKIVHEINRAFRVKRSTLQDLSRSTDLSIPLRLWSVIRTGRTWYEHQGFQLEDETERQEFFGLTTKEVTERYGKRFPYIVEQLVKTNEHVFYEAVDKIMDVVDVAPLLQLFEDYFELHKWENTKD